MQAAEGRQWQMLTLGSSEIRSRNLILPARQANALSTQPRWLALLSEKFINSRTCTTAYLHDFQIRKQQDNNVVAQLQAIVADKEAKVKQLEEEIKQCKLNVSKIKITENWILK